MTKITRDLAKFNAKFDTDKSNWWKTHLGNLETGTYMPISWPLEGLINANNTALSLEINADESEVAQKATEEIEKLLAKETRNTEVL